MSVRVPMIRSSVVNQVIMALLNCPNGAAFLRRKYGIKSPQTDLYDHTALALYLELFEDAAVLAEDSLLGARLGSILPPGEMLGPIGLLVLTSPCLRVGLESMIKYIRTWQDETEITLHDHEDTTIWSYRITDASLWPRRQDAEFTLVFTCAMARACFGLQWAPMEVHFEHERPQEWRALQNMLRAPVRFNQPFNAIIFEKIDLDRPIKHSNSGFAPYLRRHVEDMLVAIEQPQNLTEQIKAIIVRDLGHAPVNLNSIAAALKLPPRSLQRYLAQEGTSIREILRAVKIRQAKSLLMKNQRQTTNIAHAVGYTDPSAFWRAFRSWEGVSPAAFSRDVRKKPES